MKLIIRKRGSRKPYKIINNAVSITDNVHCIIVNTKKNCLMYSKPEFEWMRRCGVDNGKEK